MDARDLLLEEHSAVHSAAVGGNKASLAERTFAGLTDDQMRLRPREDLNSLAWVMWHIARAEDILANLVVNGRDQVFDDGWLSRLKIARRDFGIGMSKPEVADLSAKIDVAALRDYRDAVGRRSREIVGGYGPKDWEGEITAAALERAGALGCFGDRTEALVKGFSGRPRRAVLAGIIVMHSAGHMGEGATIRAAGGFGTGI
ncbi:MAG TPA: DinB family protein [Candidatus Bathyarchaeia archaeon]|nr:DinB family protein [Candidatus Bathyarchaeia archaeon]